MDPFTRRQLQQLSSEFYAAHATEFDASRGHHPWPGWGRLLEALPTRDVSAEGGSPAPLSVLDVGCGNARLAAFLRSALAAEAARRGDRRRPLHYVGIDANAALLEAARERLTPALADEVTLLEQDFLAPPSPGSALPEGPFELVALFGVLHHVPGRDWRLRLLEAARNRLVTGGLLALAAWQFSGRPRFERRRVTWSDLAPVLGAPVDPALLEPGDQLLRFGADPERPPRYCHQVSDEELGALPAVLGLELVADYRSDGAEGDLNRYLLLRRPRS
jgi:SAM-dependent methyltransferase